MIVSCEHCQTQFRLDDSKVPESGARVRCSKCDHSFYIPPPGQSDDLMADAQAREARQATGPSDGESDSDWEFNHDAPREAEPSGAGLDAARQAVDGLLGDLGGGPEEPLQTEAEAESEPQPEPEPEPEPAPQLEAEPEPQAAPDLALAEPEPPAAEIPAEPAPPLVAEADPVEETQEEARAAIFDMPAESEAPAAELGGPESWDLLNEEAPETAQPIGRVATVPRWKLLQQDRSAAQMPEEGEASRLGRALRAVAHAGGWLATLALLGAGAWGALRSEAPPVTQASGRLEVQGYRAVEVRGTWIENAVAGPLYVVSGKLRRTGSAAAAGLSVRLLDSGGEPLGSASTPLGPPFSERALRESDPATLRDSQSRAALEFARLHAGETVAFQALFSRVPPQAERFDLARSEAP